MYCIEYFKNLTYLLDFVITKKFSLFCQLVASHQFMISILFFLRFSSLKEKNIAYSYFTYKHITLVFIFVIYPKCFFLKVILFSILYPFQTPFYLNWGLH
jgi:hypothetical protein